MKLKQNKRKTMFCFSEIVLFQFYFSFISDVTTVLAELFYSVTAAAEKFAARRLLTS